MNAKIEQFIGQNVWIDKGDDCDAQRGVYVRAHGILNQDQDDKTFFVVIKENGYGTTSIGFAHKHIDECFVSPSGTNTIVLK